MTEVTRQHAKDLRVALTTALREFCEANGFDEPKIGSIKYGDNLRTTITLVPKVLNEAGRNTMTPEAQAYEKWFANYGLVAGKLGCVFEWSGGKYVFLGINVNAPKYPFIAIEQLSGKKMKFGRTIAPRINVAVEP